jgi:hypothetical protein
MGFLSFKITLYDFYLKKLANRTLIIKKTSLLLYDNKTRLGEKYFLERSRLI